MNMPFWVGTAAAIVLIAVAVFSIRFPRRAIWPPENRNWWIEIGIWPATALIFWGAASAGVAEWNALGWPATLRWGLGIPLLGVSYLLVSVGMWQLGLSNTTGIPARLHVDGLYARSRHPQYIGQVVGLFGWFLLCAATPVLAIALLATIMFALASYSEDRWLIRKFGARARQYQQATPFVA